MVPFRLNADLQIINLDPYRVLALLKDPPNVVHAVPNSLLNYRFETILPVVC